MRTLVVVVSLIVVFAAGAILAAGQSTPPTRVCQIGVYACPNHSDMQATWPARCPICRTVLPAVRPSASTRFGTTAVADRGDRGRGEEARERRQNEVLREQARRHERLRERARRNEELRERYRYYGSAYPPYTYVHPPQWYYYNYSPNGGYYYNPYTGYYYYYYPNSGHYYSSPYTGQYYYSTPGRYYPDSRYSYPPG